MGTRIESTIEVESVKDLLFPADKEAQDGFLAELEQVEICTVYEQEKLRDESEEQLKTRKLTAWSRSIHDSVKTRVR